MFLRGYEAPNGVSRYKRHSGPEGNARHSREGKARHSRRLRGKHRRDNREKEDFDEDSSIDEDLFSEGLPKSSDPARPTSRPRHYR